MRPAFPAALHRIQKLFANVTFAVDSLSSFMKKTLEIACSRDLPKFELVTLHVKHHHCDSGGKLSFLKLVSR
jgi:hypothetical protein